MAKSPNQHFLLVTFPAQGHINPMLQVAKRLLRAISSSDQITISTAISAHHRMLNNHGDLISSSGLAFVPFSDGYDDGYKPTDDIEHYMAELRRRGSETLREVLVDLANKGRPVTCIIYSILMPWVSEVARDFDVPSLHFWNQSAAMFTIYYHFSVNGYREVLLKNKEKEDPLYSVELPGLPVALTARDLPSFFLPANHYKFALPLFEEQCRIMEREPNPQVLVNTFDDLEPVTLKLKAVDKKFVNLIPIGPLVPYGLLGRKDDPSDASFKADLFNGSKGYLEWLKSNQDSSVVYVSFGSFAEISKRQVKEIARGLLESERPFLWVVRGYESRNKEEEEDDDEMKCLDCRIREGKGLIVSWCSQVEVLSQASIGCFVTHCGWNSTMESLTAGVPVVAVPQWTDQMANAKLFEDVWKTGVRVREIESEEGKLVESDELKRCLEMVMEGERREEMRKNAEKWRDLARKAGVEGGSSEKNLKAFLEKIEVQASSKQHS